jgi:hypothetical protein
MHDPEAEVIRKRCQLLKIKRRETMNDTRRGGMIPGMTAPNADDGFIDPGTEGAS